MLSSVACGLHPAEAGDLAVPVERRAQRVQRRQRGVHDLFTDPVTGNERGGDAGLRGRLRHDKNPCLNAVDRRPSMPS
jgi:hypothetical protein